MSGKKIRVMVVDDLRSAREMIRINLESDPAFEVVGYAASGMEAINLVSKLKPDMVTMDVRLPDTLGFNVVKKIMSIMPVPVVMITDSVSGKSKHIYHAFESGAVDVIEKSELYTFKKDLRVARDFTKKMLSLSNAKAIPYSERNKKKESKIAKSPFISDTSREPGKVIAIASSTGGPNTLRHIFSNIPENFPATFLVVQHMARGFIGGMADSLNEESSLDIRTAVDGERLSPGVALFAPDDYHMVVNDEQRIHFNRSPPVKGHRPAASILFPSVAEVFGEKVIGVILTGMGEDGAEGIKIIKDSGGKTIAQNEESCVVFGMPKEAISLGAVDRVLHFNDIAEEIEKML